MDYYKAKELVDYYKAIEGKSMFVYGRWFSDYCKNKGLNHNITRDVCFKEGLIQFLYKYAYEKGISETDKLINTLNESWKAGAELDKIIKFSYNLAPQKTIYDDEYSSVENGYLATFYYAVTISIDEFTVESESIQPSVFSTRKALMDAVGDTGKTIKQYIDDMVEDYYKKSIKVFKDTLKNSSRCSKKISRITWRKRGNER